MMHQAIVDLLAASGIVAERYSGKQETGLKNPFLCFMRRSTGDVTIKEKKIAGSAQRRRKNALLQHGSLLLRRSEFAPELPGIEDLSHDLPADPNSIIDMWMSRLEPGLGAQLSQGMLTEQEFHLAQEIEQTNYRARTWSNRR